MVQGLGSADSFHADRPDPGCRTDGTCGGINVVVALVPLLGLAHVVSTELLFQSIHKLDNLVASHEFFEPVHDIGFHLLNTFLTLKV